MVKGKIKPSVEAETAASVVAQPKTEQASPSAGDEPHDEEGGEHKKHHKPHHSHDEKRRIKLIKNKLRDGIELTDEETSFATDHGLSLGNVKKQQDHGPAGSRPNAQHASARKQEKKDHGDKKKDHAKGKHH